MEGLPLVLSIFDDILWWHLVYGEGETEEAMWDHDAKVHAFMKRCHEHNIKLNKEKAQLHRKEFPFMGHVISNEGLKAHPEKLRAVLKMPTPTDVAGVQRFIGFTNYLGKFLPKLSAEWELLRKLTVKDAEWSWTSVHETVVNRIKQLVTKAAVLKYYDPREDLILQ